MHWLVVKGARHNNLKHVDVEIPLGRFVCVTGVSGSGKSSLVNDIIREQLSRDLNGLEKVHPGAHDVIQGTGHLDKVIDIDQSPIGRTPRSNPATYVKVFDEIRGLYARLPDSRVRGYKPGRFSFNVPTGEKGGGRCEACEGNGANKVEMDFLADVWVRCPICGGRRFGHETLQIQYKGKSIYDVLDMDIQEALQHFEAIPKIHRMLSTLHDVGLDYLKLGQASTTLSGGEAQRIKLARELVKRSTGRTLYLLDEPTTGLHFDDIRRLLAVLHGFVDAGNTVIVIEHNLDVVKTADWVIDLGPEGGDEGGWVVVAGPPEEVAGCRDSYTGEALQGVLGAGGDGKVKKSKSQKVKTAGVGWGGRAEKGLSAQRPKVESRKSKAESRKSREENRNITMASRWGDRFVGRGRDEILVVGAREHNLKDVTVGVPRGRMTVCSGVSGSGKSSFAVDTVYTEGQRRYVESLSAYARQFLGQLQKPKVDHVYGLSPAIAIEQKTSSKSPRSTVGTVTEIYDYMRVLWARVGQPYCPRCDVPIGTQSSDEIVANIVALPTGTRLMLCSPIERGPGETWEAVLARCRSQGYVRVRVDGEVQELAFELQVDARRRHVVELVVDRVVVRSSSRSRIADSVEHCLALGQGVLVAIIVETPKPQEAETPRSQKVKKSKGGANSDGEMRLSQHLACDVCGRSYEEVTPHHLSFNSRLGWCPSCEGLGVQRGTRADSVIVDPDKSILDGAVSGWEDVDNRPLLRAMLVALAGAIGFDPEMPCSLLSAGQRRVLLFGLGDRWIELQKSKSQKVKKSKRRSREGEEDSEPRTDSPSPTRGGDGAPVLTKSNSHKVEKSKPRTGAGIRFQWKGFFPAIDEATRNSWAYRAKLQELATEVECQACGGGRIRPEGRAVRLGRNGETPKWEHGDDGLSLGGEARDGASIVDVCSMSLVEAAGFFRSLRLGRREARIAGELLHEIKSRLRFLVDVGLGYLTLGRAAPTLSGGESQRIRLASQIGSGLTGVLYVLDEPTIGLHPRDNRRLIGALHKLRDLGNTLLMVEHDREVIEAADHLLDFGPGAGAEGGQVVAAGAPGAIRKSQKVKKSKSQKNAASEPRGVRRTERCASGSLTGRYLAGGLAIAVPTNRRGVSGLEDAFELTEWEAGGVEAPIAARGYPPAKPSPGQAGGFDIEAPPAGGGYPPAAKPACDKPAPWAGGFDGEGRRLVVRGARQNNLQSIDVTFPLGRFVCVTGVSGSGKSSLVTEVLYPALAARIHRARMTPGAHDRIEGLDHVDKVINVNQQPIGNSPLSNPATYTGVFDVVREVFAKLPDSRIRGYTVNRFSFNRPGGRCDDCDGLGQVCHEMHFLPDVWVPCETCGGTRYQRETLEVRYKSKNIADVLAMPVSEALALFVNVPKLRRLLETLEDVGLGYLPLGQSAPTLSGGEAQRVKLAAELGRPNTGKTVYILDEPTTGLHFDDLRRLLDVLHRLIDLGNTVICIEHNMDVIKTADWIIDLGPEAGDAGGTVVAAGSPETVAGVAASHTGRLLAKVLAAGPRRPREVFDPKKAAAAGTAIAAAELASAGPRVKMPWERAGRRWHTQGRIGRDGKAVAWEGRALEYVIGQIERLGKGKLLPTDWNDRARVELRAKAPRGLAQGAVPWFCHALTGGRWLLDLLFRVPRGTFAEVVLAAKLGLKTLDERDDIPAYGQTARVQMRPAMGPMEQVRVLVHDRKEIATRAFGAFLSAGLKAYLAHVDGLAEDAGGAEPWKKDGKKWHLSQASIPASQPKLWRPMTLMALLGIVNKAAPGIQALWDRKVFVELVTTEGKRVGKIITNKGYALRVDLNVPRGRFTPTQVEHLGTQQEFARPGSSGAELTFWLQSIDEIHEGQLKRVLEPAGGE